MNINQKTCRYQFYVEFIYDSNGNIERHHFGCNVFRKQEFNHLNSSLKQFKLKIKKDGKRRVGEFRIALLKNMPRLTKGEKLKTLSKRYRSFRRKLDKIYTAMPCHSCKHHFPGKIKVCVGCKQTFYCSLECQRNDWADHKPTCDYFNNL